MTRSLNSRRRSRMSCSVLAVATVLVVGASPAAAQSFQGTGTVTSGSGSISTGAGTTDISIGSSQAVIDWTPTDNGMGGGAIDFQPGGTTATFNGTEGNFAVLNRVNVADPSRMIAMSGTINSLIGGEVTGGSIHFYSPSGFVIGASAAINVGSLVLSASPIAVDGNGQFITGINNSVTFGQAVNPAAAIVTNSKSVINAMGAGSYVALVAPRVQHDGTINVNGAAALVGAEAATISFRAGGLFDIQVDVGTTDANGVTVGNTGVIAGPASSGASDFHRAYLVAVPKNSLLTMAIASGSNLGFEIAGAADVVGNAVVLSAGHDIQFGSISSAPSAASGAVANISQQNSNFTSALYGRASGSVTAGASGGGASTFASDVSLRAGSEVELVAANSGSTVSVGGNLTLSANADGLNEGDSATAGVVELMAFGGASLSVTGTTDLTAIGRGAFSSTSGIASGDGTGGTILVQSTTGSDMSLGGSLTADASGRGGFLGSLGVDGGDGFGGTVSVFASGGSSLSVTGGTDLRADGRAASTIECFCGGIGGIGDGGTVNVGAFDGTGNVMDLGGNLAMQANGYGGQGVTGDGGAGLGGNGNFLSADGSIVTVAGDVSIQAYGFGGQADGETGNGGAGTGGNVQSFASDAGLLQLDGNLTTNVDGYGGQSTAGIGGTGTGGLGQLFTVDGGDATVAGYASITAFGNGGGGVTGGVGTGGSAYFSSSNGGNLSITGFAELWAQGNGGHGFDGDGGVGNGGHAEAYANDAVLSFGNDLHLEANGRGGGTYLVGATSGDGFGGEIYLQAVAGGTVTVAGMLEGDASGIGGNTDSLGINGGDGTGGTANIYSRDGNSSLSITGRAEVSADGEAGYAGECYSCGGIGGEGQGGSVFVRAQTGTGNTLDFGDTLYMSADGVGGVGATGPGGNGTGGFANLGAGGGSAVTIEFGTFIQTNGYGGYDAGGGLGGNGTGGEAVISTFAAGVGNSLSFGGDVYLDATGYGGGSLDLADGVGGNGTGGFAHIYAQSGTINIAGDLHADGTGHGGISNGTGGDGLGKAAEIFVDGGDTTIAGSAYIDVSGYGGNGFDAGNGTGGGTLFPTGGGENGAHIFARNGDISIGVGGSETAAVVESNGYGGSASFRTGGGGTGGDGTGGWASIQSANSDLGPSSITIPAVYISAIGAGGAGGNGDSGTIGDDGGNGGLGDGGSVGVSAHAGNGAVHIASLVAAAQGIGGIGGDGGSGSEGPGGDGGNGGAAWSGNIGIGTTSGNTQAAELSDGLGDYGTIVADASATGGNGGAGGLGSPQGNGGDGGDATSGGDDINPALPNGGGVTIVVRGSTVNLDSAVLFANATGGDGGAGAVQGDGGDATIGVSGYIDVPYDSSGGVAVLVTNRFQMAQRGQLNAGTITGTAIATAGAGDTDGLSQSLGGSQFEVRNGDASIGSLSFEVLADTTATDALPDRITITGGDVEVSGDFAFTTSGDLSVFLSNSSLTGDNVILSAGDFVPDSVNPPPGNPGTIFANTAIISTGNNFIADANIDTVNDLIIAVPGSIQFDQAISDGSIDLWALNGSINIEGVNAGAALHLLAATSIHTDDIVAGSIVSIEAQGDWINVGHILAGNAVSLVAGTYIEGDDITTPGSIFAQTLGGDMQFGNLTGADVTLLSNGSIYFGEIAGFAVNLNAGGLISGGNVDSETDIIATAGSRIDLGDLEAGFDDGESFSDGSVHMTAGWDIATGAIDAQGFVELFAGGNIGTADIIAGDYIDVFTNGGAIALGNLDAGTSIDLEAIGTIAFGNVITGALDFDAGGAVSGGNIVASEEVTGEADGSVTLGNISAGIGNPGYFPEDGFSVGIAATGPITTGDVEGAHAVGFATLASLTTGDLSAGEGVMALVGGDMNLGSITTAPDGQVYFANASMFLDAGGPDDFDPNLVLALDPVPTGGSITIGGPVSTGWFRVAAGGDLNTVAINADDIDASAGGTATIDGAWSAGNVNLASNDINITANGSISAGDLDLVSTNATRTIVGDGFDLSGYELSDAEYDRLNANDINVIADTSLGAAPLMLIGDLSVDASDGEGINEYEFRTYDGESETGEGSIRILGDMALTGMGSGDAVSFTTGIFELDAATGLLRLESSPGTLGGNLEIIADRIHVASGEILDQLAEDPQFDGYEDDLNAPAAVQVPGGVIRAANIIVYPTEAVLIQNTGTADVPAGFLANTVDVVEGEGAEPGSIELIVNGQLTGESGPTTGVAVRDAFVIERNLAVFSGNSMINGCLLTGTCGETPPPPPEEPSIPIDPVRGIATEITLFSGDPLGEQPFGNEPVIDEDEGGESGEDVDNSMTVDGEPLAPDDGSETEDDESSSPIEPPAPLFDTRPLNPDANVDEPISGSGNPALMGTGQPTNSGDEQ